MSRKIKIILILLTLSVTLSFMSDTYSRYIVSTDSNVEMSLANWQILVNDTDITDNTTTSLAITPVIEESNHIKANTLAPSSKGYFDILINPSNVKLSFNYTAKFNVLNENMTDIKISKYAILDENYVEGETIVETQNIIDNAIAGSLTYDNKTENFAYKPFTIRVYFEWYEGENENMDNEQDSTIGIDAAHSGTKLQIEATLKFEQNNKTATE